MGAFVATLVLHAAAVRLPGRVDSVRRFLLVGVPAGVLLSAAVFSTHGHSVEAYAAIGLYAFLCELYIFCFTLAISSVSVMMLITLREGRLDEGRFSAVHEPGQMVDLRISRLIRTAFLEHEQGRLRLTEKGVRLDRAFAALRRFFGHETG